MIEKKQSGSSDSFDQDDLDDVHSAERDEEVENDVEETGEADAAAMLARQKRNGAFLTYGIGLAFAVFVGFLAYPKFKHFFVSSAPAPSTFVGTSVPQNARKNYFPDAGDTSLAPADKAMPQSLGTGIDADIAGSKTVSSAQTPVTEPSSTLPAPPAAPASTATNEPSATKEMPAEPLTPPASQTATSPSSNQLDKTAPSSPNTAAASSTAPIIIPSLDEKTAVPQDDVKGLKNEIEALKTSDEARDAALQKLQATVDSLQKQLADKIDAAPQVTTSPQPAHSVPAMVATAPKWELRSAIEGAALIGKPNSAELKHVIVGDIVTGLGKITSIREQDGRWIVQGTNGSITQ